MSVIKVYDKIFEEIRQRYSPTSIIEGAADNEAIFDYFQKPRYKNLKKWSTLFNRNLNILIPQLSEKFDAAFPGVIKDTIYEIPSVRDYCKTVTGFDPLDPEDQKIIFKMLDDIREKDLNIAVVGYGGAMINWLWDLWLLAYHVGYTKPIFRNIIVYEKENLSFTNLLRVGKPVALNSYVSVLLTDDNQLNKLNLIREEFNLAQRLTISERYLEDGEELDTLRSKDFIFIGAPNLQTRVMLENDPFFFFGHGDNELEVFYRPRVDTELSFETYGKVDIPVLLSNIAAGTIQMLGVFNSVQNKKDFSFEQGESVYRIDYNEYLGISS